MLQIKSWGDFDGGIVERGTLDKLDTAVYWLSSIAKNLEHFLILNLMVASYKE